MLSNSDLIKILEHITVSKVSDSNTRANESIGIETAMYMDEIYKKLVQLNKNEDVNGYPKE